jgi:hypothetical protein
MLNFEFLILESFIFKCAIIGGREQKESRNEPCNKRE